MTEIEEIKTFLLSGKAKHIKIGNDVWDITYAGKEINKEEKYDTMMI